MFFLDKRKPVIVTSPGTIVLNIVCIFNLQFNTRQTKIAVYSYIKTYKDKSMHYKAGQI